MKRFILLSFLVVLLCFDLFPQSKAEMKNSFYDAESWILFEAYKDALPLYQQLLRAYPDNANFKYRIGQCYLNIPGQKGKSVGYLEEAVKNINPLYKEGTFRESGAPFDALYYLANAYRINNQLDKAIETYGLFRKKMDTRVYDSTIVSLQVQSCYNAIELMDNPEYIKSQNLGNVINESNSEFNPVVSENEDMLVFSKSEAFYDAILYSVKVNGRWETPKNMNELLKVDRDLFPTSLSADGKTLYLYSSADYDGIIYTTNFENGTWGPLVKLNQNINTKYWESHATVSHDNKKLYFTSNRKGTLGGLDIYVSVRDSTGDWGTAVNLGSVINTPYNEESPFLSSDDRTLFFSSRGHFNIGGYDVFSSLLKHNGEWSEPVNCGYPLNTTDDDVFFKPVKDGHEGYYAIDGPTGFGSQDIYRIEIFSDDHPRKFLIRGVASVADLLKIYDDSVRISVMNTKKPGNTLIVYTNPNTWEYEFNMPQGNYKINFEGYGGEKVTKELNLPLSYPFDTFELTGTVLPRTDFIADLNVESENNILVSKGDSLLFPLRVEPKSSLTIENWSGENMVSTENHPVTTSLFNYKMSPEKGDNRVIFKLTDRFNNTATTEVSVTRMRELPSTHIVRPEYSHIIAKKKDEAYRAIDRNLAVDTTSMPEAVVDPAIAILREKLNTFSERSEYGPVVILSITRTDQEKIVSRGKWLRSVYDESIRQGMTSPALAEMFVLVGSNPETKTTQFLDELVKNSVEPITASLKSLNLNSERLKTPGDLLLFLLNGADKQKYPGEPLFTSVANMITAANIPSERIRLLSVGNENKYMWLLWLVPVVFIIFLLLLFMRRKKKKNKEDN